MAPCQEHEEILLRLERVRRQWRAVHIGKGVFLFLTIQIGMLTLFLAAQALPLDLPALLRPLMFGLLTMAALAGFAVLILGRMLRNKTDEEVALLVEAAFPDSGNCLINAVRLGKEELVPSTYLLHQALRESARRTAPLNFARAVDKRGFKKLVGSATGVTLLLTLLLVLFPSRMLNALDRILQPTKPIPKIGSVKLTVTPGNATIAAGDTLKVDVVVQPLEHENLTKAFTGPLEREDLKGWLEYRIEGADIKQQLMTRVSEVKRRTDESQVKPGTDRNEIRFHTELRQIKTNLRYRVRVYDTESKWYQVTVIDPPAVKQVSLLYQYPKYTGLEDQIVDDSDGDITAVVGARVKVTVRTTKPVKTGWIEFDGESNDPLQLERHAGGASLATQPLLTVEKDRTYTVHLKDEFDLPNRQPVVHTIKALLDKPPKVQISKPAKDMTLTAGDTMGMVIKAEDVYGIRAVEIVEERHGKERIVTAWKDLAAKKNVLLPHDWHFKKTEYENGETIRYYARAYDYYDSDASTADKPRRGVSKKYEVRLEDVKAKKKEMVEKYTDWESRLRKVLDKMKKLRKDTGQTLGEGSK